MLHIPREGNFRERRSIHALLLLIAFFTIALATSALADDLTPANTRIITDEEHGAVVIVIDGEPAVLIDENGLHVVNELNYGASLTDTGRKHLKSLMSRYEATGQKETQNAKP